MPVSLALRPATLADVDDIVQIQQESWQQAYQGLLPEVALILRPAQERAFIWQQRLKAHPCMTLLAQVQDAVAGFLYWFPENQRVAQLKSFYLHPFYWQQGLGSALLSEALQDMQDVGLRRCELWVLANNRPAERFYLKQGFQYDGQRQRRQMEGVEVVQRHMYRLLTTKGNGSVSPLL
ncbi:MAG: GNAT family N-acetyltransferase [Aeromonadaceae bacterium]|nr:GNAT family N-acetyltransferase [Aeromonadaceae bacterium]